ncbi:CDP-alcohol phosphatidyltransferase family protein [Enterovirga sp.]|jgi:cardiolipin synthase|uniref:CDP-alcohol phosphatidyltransferase family protein n=1 Tax=Enterovirga sp. TaxID=2026350 RepID=UPI002615CCD4|nr:CDP-alcohol phosphatidyltransferase family protein [Enterovirga sp.]MDB5591724.1 CDP-alcohol phosphatidyltransferase [Enterovirga sp.]
MTIPNLITIARLIMVPIVVVMIGQGLWMAAFLVFVVAGISDAADGIIARRYHLRTELGAYLDPLADKALLVSIYVTLSVVGVLPGWLAVIVVSRDAMIVSAILVSRLMDRPVEIKPLFVSKLNTAAQIAYAALVLGMMAMDDPPGRVLLAGMVVVAVLTVLSAAAYLARWLRHMAG